MIVDTAGRPMQRKYEAANISRRTAGWITRSSGPNVEIALDLVKLRDRHRDLARNNPWSRRAINAVVNNTVGDGIRAQWGSSRRQARWSAWWESTQCDASGRLDGYGIQSLAMRTAVESGECLIRKRPRRPEDGLAVPLQLQILEPDYLDHRKTEALVGGGWITQGVEYDSLGRRVAYWLFPQHPGDPIAGRATATESERKPASEFLHIYRQDRPGQVRGVPWGVGAYLRLRMLDDYQDAQLERQRIAACFMGFRRMDPLAETESRDYVLTEKIEPGFMEDLPPGSEPPTFATPPQPEDDTAFVNEILRAVAADYGIPYEILTGNLSEVNFSSARLGFQEFGRSIDVWRWQMLNPLMLSPIAQWFLEAESVAGFGGRPEVPLWTAPARVLIDPAREIPALQAAVLAGFESLPNVQRSRGFDPIKLAKEQADYLKAIDKMGLAFNEQGNLVLKASMPARNEPDSDATPETEPESEPESESESDSDETP